MEKEEENRFSHVLPVHQLGFIDGSDHTPSNEHGLKKWKQFRGAAIVDMGPERMIGLLEDWIFAREPQNQAYIWS